MNVNRIAMMILLLALAATSAFGNPPPDPTRAPSAQEIQAFFGHGTGTRPEARQWQLQSVLIADQRRVAIINGQRVSEGDRIDSAEVITIEPGRVALRHRSEEIVLTLASRRQRGTPQ